MTKKDFILIASIMRKQKNDSEEWLKGCEQACDDLQKTNPRFDKEKFLRACGIMQWACECGYEAEWNRYEDGTPVCPECDEDLKKMF